MHWYNKQGDPVYQVPYADPKKGMRDTTLRDAKKMGLGPSVTSVLDVLNKPGLVVWKINEMMMAALTTPVVEGESESDFIKRVKESAAEKAKIARDTGQDIHDAVEKRFHGKQPLKHIQASAKIYKAIVDCFGTDEGWEAEVSFYKNGYGGRIDLINKTVPVLLDLKTKEEIEPGKCYAYDEHGIQLAAYAAGIDFPDIPKFNVFTDWAGDNIIFHEWGDTTREKAIFDAAFELWKIKHKYDPEAIQ